MCAVALEHAMAYTTKRVGLVRKDDEDALVRLVAQRVLEMDGEEGRQAALPAPLCGQMRRWDERSRERVSQCRGAHEWAVFVLRVIAKKLS